MSIIDYSHYSTAPWMKHYADALKRCNKKYKQCYKTETKFLLSQEEIRFLWFRDKAMDMHQASLDREDSSEHYTYDNCRFIEMSINRKLPRRKPVTSGNKYKGVWRIKRNGKFIVVVCKDDKMINFGCFDNEDEAALVYNKEASRLFNQKIEINKI